MSRPPYSTSLRTGTGGYHSYEPSTSTSTTNADKVASASTALDRVMGLLDGFEDDMDCPLCLEEMDISDLNFKPCPCGYQICRFCWNHIKENLNGKCPACRAPYDEAKVEFKAIKPEELKRLQAAKKLRDKKRKDEAVTVKNLSNVRVRQRAQVHVQGMTTKIANEDTLHAMKGPEQFGQYGKVLKLFMSKRSSVVSQPSTHPHYQPVNVYVNYRTPAEASLCISAIDGSVTPDGHKLKAIWGTTRYCPTYLKGGRCNNENCMQAHEPGEELGEAGPASREEIYTYHAMSDSDMTRNKVVSSAAVGKKPEATLPPTASWASKNAQASSQPTTPIVINASLPPLSATLKPTPPVRPIAVLKPQTHPLPARPSSRATKTNSNPTPAESIAPPSVPLTVEAKVPEPVASSSTPPPPAPVVVELPKPKPTLTHSNGYHHDPFPTLEFGEGTFSFSLDPDVKGKGKALPSERSEVRDLSNLESYSDLAATLSPPLPPSNGPSSYIGSFDPFSSDSVFDSPPHSASSSPPPTADDLSRRSSRFGFARRGSQGVKSGDLASAFARNAFASTGTGRESPNPNGGAPPGILPMPNGLMRSNSGSPFTSSSDGRDGLWSTTPSSLPPGVLRQLASPNHSTTPSPQLSPRLRFTGTPPGINPPSASPLPPGINLGQTPIPAASFPLPPPNPRPGNTGTAIGKEDLLALIAAAQKAPQQQQQHQQQHQQQEQGQQPFFADPAILNARLAGSQFGGQQNGYHEYPQQPPYGQQQFFGGAPLGVGVRQPYQQQQLYRK